MIFSYFSEFGFLSFYRFLLVFQDPDLSRKLREAISCILVPVRSQFDLLVPSYVDLNENGFFEILNLIFLEFLAVI